MVECLPLMRPTSSSTCFFRAAYDATFSRDGTVTSTAYPDVTEDFYYIAKAAELGIITGKPDGTFAPDEGVDRGSAAAMLLRAMEAVSKTA